MSTIQKLKYKLELKRKELALKEKKFKQPKYSLQKKPIEFLKEEIQQLENKIISEGNDRIDSILSED